ncbi:hypothetical protein ACFZBP_23535 [Streptomyces sp. NPDC008086]|uniref:hypothetical protein n=1 Tax=Streptomyces sp. NPDC008086 TaxID=3364807 RepID=UPI0036DFC71E
MPAALRVVLARGYDDERAALGDAYDAVADLVEGGAGLGAAGVLAHLAFRRADAVEQIAVGRRFSSVASES